MHDLPQAAQEGLATLIHDWLDENPHIVTDHADPACFNEIHTTNNFMPWHRTHVRALESYIAERTDNPFFRLPKWDPGVTPASGDKIPVPFRIRASTNVAEPSINVNPVPTVDMNDFLDDLILCDLSSDAGAFSNSLEGRYHNQGHGAVGGFFTDNAAPDLLIFWPWHAWVDDLWYAWERDCSKTYDIPTIAGATETVIAGTAFWSGEMFVKGIVRIPDNAALTIEPNAIIRFRESEYNAFPTRIIVEPGGLLFIGSGATLTGIDDFGDYSPPGSNEIPGSRYYTSWDGIIVQGNPASTDENAQGRVELDPGSRLEHMVNGIRSENGGIIVANGANFYNNRIDAEIKAYPFDHFSSFTNCNFINDLPLRTAEWHASGSDCGETEHHFSNQSSSTFIHVWLKDVRGVAFTTCTIDNPHKDEHNYISKGIYASNSSFSLTGCTVREQAMGVHALNALPGPGNAVTVTGSTFDKNNQGLVLYGADMSLIEGGNTFIIPDQALTNFGLVGIFSFGTAGLMIEGNNYSSSAPGKSYGTIIIVSNDNAASYEKRDNFNGIKIATQAWGNNSNLQIRCNDYNAFDFAIAISSGIVPTQGQCNPTLPDAGSLPANNTWDNCNGIESQIYKGPNASNFTYWANANQLPTCYSAGVGVQTCQTTGTTTSCANGEPPPCAGCEAQTIAALETLKNSLAPGDERIRFITHEQQVIYQQGVNERLDNEGLDDAIEFTEDVEAITAMWLGNKAALLLLKSEQEGTVVSGTSAALAAVPASDPNKKWLTLRYDLLTSGRTYSQLTATEKAMVEAEAGQQDTKSGAHAQAILEMAYGIPAEQYIEPIDLERGAKHVESVKVTSGLSVTPNPAQELAYVSFTAPETQHQSWLTISDLNGRMFRQIDLADTVGESQIPLTTADLPEGIYLLRLQLEGQPAEVKKLTIIR